MRFRLVVKTRFQFFLCGDKNADEVFPCSVLENDNETDGIAWMILLKLVVMFLYKCSQVMESSKYLFERCNMAQVMKETIE